MRVRTPHAGSLRFPELRQSSQGESGAKPRLRSVGDGTSSSYSATTDDSLDFADMSSEVVRLTAAEGSPDARSMRCPHVKKSMKLKG